MHQLRNHTKISLSLPGSFTRVVKNKDPFHTLLLQNKSLWGMLLLPGAEVRRRGGWVKLPSHSDVKCLSSTVRH